MRGRKSLVEGTASNPGVRYPMSETLPTAILIPADRLGRADKGWQTARRQYTALFARPHTPEPADRKDTP
jgi:hypothetical protein